MKKIVNIQTTILFFFLMTSLIVGAQNNPDFFLDTNGITCMCPDANIGDTGTLTINGEQKTFTKRTRQEIDLLIFNDDSDPQIALTCTSGIIDMSNMFAYRVLFNQNLIHWDVSQVENMSEMFLAAISFNYPLDAWDVNNVTEMSGMFYEAFSFNQNLSTWDFNQNINLNTFVSHTALTNQYYDSLLQKFDSLNILDLRLISHDIGYCDVTARTNLINKGWEIAGDIQGQCGQNFISSTIPFVTQWTVQNDLVIDIFTVNAFDYNYNINWGDGQSDQNVTSDISHTYSSPGTYTVSITGVFPYFKTCKVAVGVEYLACENGDKLTSVESWGDQEWRVMHGSFRDAENMVLNDTQAPNISNINSLVSTFDGAESFNQSIDNWDVSQVTDMNSTFKEATSFNQPLNNWVVSQVKSMNSTFRRAVNFNQPLDNWDVSNVEQMESMFSGAIDFNQPINNWDVSNVTNMISMFGTFTGSMSFDQSLNDWDVSSVIAMGLMFLNANEFDQPLNNWDVSNVTYMSFMFRNASSFNQDISMWCVEQFSNEPIEFAFNSGLQSDFFPLWGQTCENISVEEFYKNNILVYPNPIKNQASVSIDKEVFSGFVNVSIINLTGKLVYENKFYEDNFKLKLNSLSQGIYYMKINNDEFSIVKKIIKK